ncbi:rubrerythrin family protein [Natronomonas sp. EA1]|uniref:rubrerythrin family protein n=1 Tax=Natronomonas sp. EA1 TaxID=3421655 RepID=UPI003EBB6925
MDADSLLEAVREDNRTALSRLGSSKSLYADTKGEMDADTVLTAAADAEFAAAETFAQWADAEPVEDVAAAFDESAAEERDHYDRVAAKLDDHDPGDISAIQAYLRGCDTTLERLGGFLGRTLAAEKSKEQLVGFFVGQADPKTSQLFRELGADLDDQLERVSALLEAHCDDERDWETAKTAAGAAIQAAYDEYTERLEGMGVNPKPVC